MYQNAHLWLGNLDLIIVFPCHPLRSRVLASRHGENWGGRSKHFVFGTLLHTRSQTYCGFLLLQRHTMSWGRSKGTKEWKVKTLHDTILTYCHPPFVQFVHKVTSALGRHGSSFINLKEASKEVPLSRIRSDSKQGNQFTDPCLQQGTKMFIFGRL